MDEEDNNGVKIKKKQVQIDRGKQRSKSENYG